MEDVERDIHSVLSQVSIELEEILLSQPDATLERIYSVMGVSAELQCSQEGQERVSHLLELLTCASPATCCCFIHTVTMVCDLPMHLESLLLSVAEWDSVTQASAEEPPAPPKEKRARREKVERYRVAVRDALLQNYAQVTRDMPEMGLDEECVRVQEGAAEATLNLQGVLDRLGGVTALVGPPGSGKTLLSYCVAARWAELGLPCCHFLFLLELRHLRQVREALTLTQLLFRFFLPPKDEEEEAAVLDFLLEKPQNVCFILDGVDDLADTCVPSDLGDHCDLQAKLAPALLIAALCGGGIVRGCSLLITCRTQAHLQHLPALRVFNLLGFDRRRVSKYGERFFLNKAHGTRALQYLLNEPHLLALCHLPALCHLCCVCADRLFSRGHLPCPPSSRTQVYLQLLEALVGGAREVGGACLPGVCTLALQALEKGSRYLWEEEIQPPLLQFGVSVGLLRPLTLGLGPGACGRGFAFCHFSVQEFLAALHLLSGEGVANATLRAKLIPRTRWPCSSRSGSAHWLHLYLCGLTAPVCESPLRRLLPGRGCVARLKCRRVAVLKILQNFASTSLTGPKLLELCRCTHEAQSTQLAKKLGAKTHLELRNIKMETADMEALAFVISTAETRVTLDLGGCSLEPKSLELLMGCQYLSTLIFRSRKYDDKFAESLSALLPTLPDLARLEFVGGRLTDAGAVKLAAALQKCSGITDVNLSDNSLTDKGLCLIVEILPRMLSLTTAVLGKNNISLDGVFAVLEQMMVYPTTQTLYVNEDKDVKELRLYSRNQTQCTAAEADGRSIRLHNCSLTPDRMTRLCQILGNSFGLSVVELTGEGVTDKSMKVMCDFLQDLCVCKQIMLNSTLISVDGLCHLTQSLRTCPSVSEINLRLVDPSKVCVMFGGETRDTPVTCKKLRLMDCRLQPAHMDKLLEALRGCDTLTLLDLSRNNLQNSGLKKLLGLLPQLSAIHEVHFSENNVNMQGIMCLATYLSTSSTMSIADISRGGGEKLMLRFDFSESKHCHCRNLHKKFKLRYSKISAEQMEELCMNLLPCASLIQLDLSDSVLEERSFVKLLKHLPTMAALRLLNLSGVALQDEDMKHFQTLSDMHQASCTISFSNPRLRQQGVLHLVRVLALCEPLVSVRVSRLQQEETTLIRFSEKGNNKTLSIIGCHFKPQHLVQLADTLQTCSQLHRLHLSHNALQAEALCVLWKSLSTAASLRTIELHNNGLSQQMVEELFKELGRTTKHMHLQIKELWIVADAVERLVCNCIRLISTIQWLRVEGTSLNVTLQQTEFLASTGSMLRTLGLVDCGLKEKHLSFLRNIGNSCHMLQELDLSNNNFGLDGAECLSSVLPALVNLKRLRLENRVTADGELLLLLQGLSKCSHLQTLSLTHYAIDKHCVSQFAVLLPGLTELQAIDLSHCVGLTPNKVCDLLTALRCCCNLQDLRLKSLQLDGDGVAHLAAALPRTMCVRTLILSEIIKTKETSDEAVVSLLVSLGSFQQVEVIELDGLRMGDRGLLELVTHLLTWTGLRRISLSDNCISDQGGETLAEALSHCTLLQEINLSRNLLGEFSAFMLGRTLPMLTQLRVLDLQHNALTPVGAAALAQGLCGCNALQELDVSENQLGPDGAHVLTNTLTALKCLRRICLVSVGTADLSRLIEALLYCASVEDVSLGWNGAGDDVAMQLAEVLPLCQRMTRIDLESNNITVRGAECLVSALRVCSSVRVIRLWKNSISQEDAQRLSAEEHRLNFSST